MKRILVPLDGSAFAQQALPLATELANRLRANLTIVSVAASPYDARVFGDEVHTQADRERVLRYLERQALELGSVGTGPVQYELLIGNPAPTLAAWVDRNDTDLVVMTTHGRGPLSRFWLGSVADYLLGHVTKPLLLTRVHDGHPIPTQWRRILVATDLAAGSDHGLGAAVQLARAFEAELTLMHVVSPTTVIGAGFGIDPAGLPADYTQRLVTAAEQSLTGTAESLRAQGLRASTWVRVAESPPQAIIAEAANGGFDLIAVTTRATHGLARALLGSVADKVVRGTEVPVLVVHAPSAPPT